MIKRTILFFFFYLLSANTYAESIKFLQWWDEYIVQRIDRSGAVGYGRKTQAEQGLDVDNDGINNDSRLCIPFNLQEDKPLHPEALCVAGTLKNTYRNDRPSSVFYGGMVANYTQTADQTVTDSLGRTYPLVRSFAQASVQPDGASMILGYNPSFPTNIRRMINNYNVDKLYWSDMTFFAVDPAYTDMSEAFLATPEAQVNWASVFLWKKSAFVNGGASAERIILDETSRIMFDAVRHRRNIQEARIIIQDGNNLFISEVSLDMLAANNPLEQINDPKASVGNSGTTLEFKPLNSRWAYYGPTDCDMIFLKQFANFEEHEFTDIQAVGLYLATPEFRHAASMLTFDNFRFYGTTPELKAAANPPPSLNTTDNPSSATLSTAPFGIGFTTDGQFLATNARFYKDINAYGNPVTVRGDDTLDIRGLITVDPAHIGAQADLFVVVEASISDYVPMFFVFNSTGWMQAIDILGNLSQQILPLRETLALRKEEIVQIFPVRLDAFRNDEVLKQQILLGCADRPMTYSGKLNFAPLTLKFYYGYRLVTDGTLVFSAEPIDVRLTP